MKLSDLKIDLDAEINGVWHDIGDGASIKVARNSNKNYAKVATEVLEEYSDTDLDNLPEDQQLNALAKIVSESVLVGWKGFTDDKGEDVKYSKEAAYEILSDPQYRDFFVLVDTLSKKSDSYRAKVKKK